MGQYAVNPQTGAVAQLVNNQWQPVPKQNLATNPDTGAGAVFNGQDWEELPTPSTGSNFHDLLNSTATAMGQAVGGTAALPDTILRASRGAAQASQAASASPDTPQATKDAIAAVNTLLAGAPKLPPIDPTAGPIEKILPTQEGMDQFIFRGGKGPIPYYVPSTPAGRLYQAGVRGATGGAIGGPLAMGLGAVGGVSQEGAKQLGLPPWVQETAGVIAPMIVGGAPQLFRTILTTPKRIAGRILEGASTNPNAAINPPPIQGMPLSTAQATRDPGLQALQRTVEQSSPEMQGQFNALRANQNQAVAGEMQTLGNMPGQQSGANVEQMRQGSAGMHQAIADAYDAAHDTERTAWNQAGTVLKTPLATLPVKQDLIALKAELGPERDDLIPGYVTNVVDNKWQQMTTLNGIKNLRTRVMNDARAAFRAGDANTKDVLDSVSGILEKQMNTVQGASAQEQAALDAARQASRDLHGQFGDSLTKRILKTDNSGNPIVAPTSIAPKYLDGTPEGLTYYLRATGGTPEAIQSAKDYLIAGLKNSAETSVRDSAGNAIMSPAKFGGFLEKNQAYFNDPRLFTADERAILTRAQKGLDVMNSTANSGIRGGPDTYSKLAGGKYLESFLGPKVTSFLKMTAGYAGWLKGGPLGAVGGYLGANALGAAFERVGKSTVSLVNDAMLNPARAAELRAFLANPSMQTFTPGVKASLGMSVMQPAMLGSP